MGVSTPQFEVLIVGGGPAGVSTAIWCSDLGLRALLLEKEAELGGQLFHVHNPIANYPGVWAKNGRALREMFLTNHRFEFRTGVELSSVDLSNKTVDLTDGTGLMGRAIVIATGVRRRRLGIPGEVEFAGRGVLESGVESKSEVVGKHVLIVGGGDAAVENAMILSETADRVTLVHRRELTARTEFVNAVENTGNIELRLGSTVKAIQGDRAVESVEIQPVNGGAGTSFAVDNVLIRIGVEPNTAIFDGQVDLDTDGYIIVNNDTETSLRDVFAVGDAASPHSPTIATAVGMGATAAKIIKSRVD